jgi:glutathione-regulated potassium-efflux system protein KefB
VSLQEIAVLLAALALAGPLARWVGMAAVLGYLFAGLLIGPFGIGAVFNASDAKEVLHTAEFGVVLLLFLIGLELRPKRLYAMRYAIFGLGSAQVGITALLLAAIGTALGFAWQSALFAGAALALSSTAFALQVLEENGELSTRHGRLGFSVLLFQDLAAIPLIALAPFFAVSAASATSNLDTIAFTKGLATIAAVVVIGRYLLDFLLRLVALSRVKEAMTAAALLTVVGVTLIMQQVGLPASLGAFIAGALLAESSYRHQLEADIAPFEGLLLGMFFTAIGMSLNLGLLITAPILVLALTVGLMFIKALVLFLLGRWQGLDNGPARRLALALAQGGEFAFVLLTVAQDKTIFSRDIAELLAVVVTLSMALTPLLLALERRLFPNKLAVSGDFDTLPVDEGHVVIAGFGRFGQIIARVLRAKGIAFTALDISAEQVEFVKKFGSKAFYGDASRPEVLEAAQLAKARAFVLAIDDVEASMRTAEHVKVHYPHVPIYARARNRTHAHRLLDLGVKALQRETLLSSLDLTKQLLSGLGYSDRVAQRAVETFRTHDERRLIEDYQMASDIEKIQEKARSDAVRLEKLFEEDAQEEVRLAGAEGRAPQAKVAG